MEDQPAGGGLDLVVLADGEALGGEPGAGEAEEGPAVAVDAAVRDGAEAVVVVAGVAPGVGSTV